MANLRLGAIENDKPVKLTIEFPANVHRDLVAYSEMLARDDGSPVEPTRLIAPMLSRFMTTDREFGRRRRSASARERGSGPS